MGHGIAVLLTLLLTGTPAQFAGYISRPTHSRCS